MAEVKFQLRSVVVLRFNFKKDKETDDSAISAMHT